MAGITGLTSEERITALKQARAIRTLRAAIRAELWAGKRSAESILTTDFKQMDLDLYRALKGMRVYHFVSSFPGIGPAKAEKAMDDCGIDRKRRLGGLGAKQRLKLLAWLQARNIA